MIKAKDIVVGYRNAVAGPLDFEFSDGDAVMLCGPNGSGKSTLLKTLAGLLKPMSGCFEAGGQVVMVPTHIPKVKGFTVKEFIRTSFLTEAGMFRKLDRKSEEILDKAVATLGLEGLVDKDLGRISDGEFQKACIATALTRHANVMLLDEPTAFLDVDNRVMVLRTLQEIAHNEKITIIFSTHDIHDGEIYSDKTLKLERQ